MILSPESKIASLTAAGHWGTDTIDDLFRANARAVPDRLAIADAPNRSTFTDGPPRRLSYAELDAFVDAVAAELLDRGVGRDDIVVIQMPNVVENAATLLACSRLGAVASPVAVQYREHELGFILGLLQPKAFVTLARVGEHRAAELARKLFPRVFSWGPGEASLDAIQPSAQASARVAAYLAEKRPGANDVVTICWTSGTEARPKGVPRSHNQWLSTGRVVASAPALGDGEVLLAPFPMINMASIGGALMPWVLRRGTMILHHPFDMPTFLGQTVKEGVTYNLLPPAVLNGLIKQKQLLAGLDLKKMRNVCSGSAPLAPWMVEAWQKEQGICVVNFFGSNEGTALASAAVDVPDPVERARFFPRFGVPGLSWSIDAALGFETRLVDPVTGLVVTERGKEGELCIRGSTVFDGYFREPELNRGAFDAEGYFHTGDLFTIEGEGAIPRFYKFVGRSKEIVIRGGQNISPAEVENLLSSHPGVADAACVGVPDERLGEQLCAVVVARPGSEVTLPALTEHLRGLGVANFKWPERLVVLPALPRNPVGKLVRRALRDAALAAPASGAPS
jgi:acyl-CoA synthetase (AMP-forming)/AMP-acid ligase II